MCFWLFLAYTNPNADLRATNSAFWVFMVLRKAREQSLAQQGTCPVRSSRWCALGRSTAWAGLLPRASYHQLKKLPKPCLTMWDHVWCPTFQTRSVFLDTITILKRRAVWEFHLDNPWPANEFRTAQCLRAMRTGSLSRSREQPRCQVLFLGQTPGTLFQHYIICLDLTQLRCPVPSLPFTAQLCIWYL